MNNTTSVKKPFPVAAIFFLVYGFLRLCTFGYQIYTGIMYGYSFDVIDDSIRTLIPLAFLALGVILLITRKNSIVLPILLGILMICFDLFWLIPQFNYYLEYISEIYTLCDLLGYFTEIAAFVLLILFSILSMVSKKKKCGLLVVWFIPGILFLVSLFLFNYNLFTDIEFFLSLFEYESGIIYVIHILSAIILFTPSMFLFGYWLYKENKYKALSVTPMTIPAYREDNTAPAFDTNASLDTQYNEQAAYYNQTPVYNNQPAAPIQQSYAQAPAYNNQYNAPMQQPIYNPQYSAPVQQPVQGQMHVTDELLKYKSLLDAGAITQEEYEIKKKQLLGL